MNLHGVASGIVSAVNPMIDVIKKHSADYATAPDGTRSPVFSADETISIQLQGMSEAELKQVNELNIGGILRKVYTAGYLSSLDRKTKSGGDLLVFGAETWLVVHVLEQWPDWCAVIIQKQVD